MKRIKVGKLWNGRVSLRDYLVKESIDKGNPIIVEYNHKTMFLSVNKLRTGIKNNLRLVSKWGNKVYDLLDYDWKPNDQMTLL